MKPRKCAEVQRELAWHIAEEAGTALPAGISQHFLECLRCAGEAHRLEALLGSLSPGAVPDPPDAYWQSFLPRLRIKLAAQGVDGRVSRAWIWAFSGTAACFFLAGLTVGRWEIPPEIRARLHLEKVAEGIDPDSLQQALDTLLPDSDPGIPPGSRNESAADAANMARALEEVLPENESGFNGAVREQTSVQERRVAQSPDPGWV
jgi:hypothetical protein